jgi:hypothetical protein
MGYERFSAKIFRCPFSGFKAGLGRPSRADRVIVQAVFTDVIQDLSLVARRRSPVPKPFNHAGVAGFWQENVGNSYARIWHNE